MGENSINKIYAFIFLILIFSVAMVIAVVSDSKEVISNVINSLNNYNRIDVGDDGDAKKLYDVQRLEECYIEEYIESTPVYNECSETVTLCSDEPVNQSCEEIVREYTCYSGEIEAQKTKNICETKGYKIGNHILDTKNYICNVDDSDSAHTTIICDSEYDGNGDGICTSGESCIKFVITDEGMDNYKKNSLDEYVKDDSTFFLNEIIIGVEE